MLLKRLLWTPFAILSVSIGLYPVLYFLIDREFGLLSTKPDTLLHHLGWNIGFYTHIVPGGVALLVGWTQFSTRLRDKRPALHRRIGYVYLFSVLFSSLAGIYIGMQATGGVWSALGFICLGITWFATTLLAYRHILGRNVAGHQELMVYSYAACFAAVTLRLWLPLLSALFQDFTTAYRMVAWLCWVPNMAAAYWISATNKKR